MREERSVTKGDADVLIDPRANLTALLAAWRGGNALHAAAHFAIDGVYAEAGRPPVCGRDALIAHFARFFRDGPAWRITVGEILVDGIRACVAYRFAIEGTGHVWRERAGCALVQFDHNGAITEWREYEG